MELHDVGCLGGGEQGGKGGGERGAGGGEGGSMAVVVSLLVRDDAFSSLAAMTNPASVKRNLMWSGD